MTSDNLQRWALVAEIVSGVAVVATLFILIVEIRGNTEMLRVSSYQELISNSSDWREMIISNSDLANLYSSFRNNEVPEFSSQEGLQLSMLLSNLWSTYESAYFSHQSGLINDLEWSRFERSICLQYGLMVLFPDYLGPIQAFSSDQFFQFVTDLCVDNVAANGT